MHLPLSAGKIVMLGSLCSVFSASLSWLEMLDGGNLALKSAADTLSLSCSVSGNLFLLMANSAAVVRSVVGSSFWGYCKV